MLMPFTVIVHFWGNTWLTYAAAPEITNRLQTQSEPPSRSGNKRETRGNHREEKAGELLEPRQESARWSPKCHQAGRRGGASVPVADFGTGAEVRPRGRGAPVLRLLARSTRGGKHWHRRKREWGGRWRGAGMRCSAGEGGVTASRGSCGRTVEGEDVHAALRQNL